MKAFLNQHKSLLETHEAISDSNLLLTMTVFFNLLRNSYVVLLFGSCSTFSSNTERRNAHISQAQPFQQACLHSFPDGQYGWTIMVNIVMLISQCFHLWKETLAFNSHPRHPVSSVLKLFKEVVHILEKVCKICLKLPTHLWRRCWTRTRCGTAKYLVVDVGQKITWFLMSRAVSCVSFSSC